MSLAEVVSQDLILAMKSQDKVKLNTLRQVKTALENHRIQAGNLDEAASVVVLQKLCKQRKESIQIYESNSRNELAQVESQELAIIETYLPRSASPEQLADFVGFAIVEENAVSIKDMGRVIQRVKAIAAQNSLQVDAKEVSLLVKARLNS